MRNIWNRTFGAIYYKAFKRYFDTTLSRLSKMLGDIHRIDKRLEELERHIHALLEAGWQEKALARRIAALEDRLARVEDGAGDEAAATTAD